MNPSFSDIENVALRSLGIEPDEHFQQHIERFPEPPVDAAFHGLAGEYVRAVEPHSEADRVAILVSFLVGFGNIIGRTAHFSAESVRHFCNLYVALVGVSAKGRKGSGTAQGKRPLEGADPDWFDERIETGLSSGEGVINAVRDEVDDNGNPVATDKRIFIIEEEFARALRAMQRDGNTLSPVLRAGWDSGTLRVLTRKDPLRATDVHMSVLGHITRDEITALLSNVEISNGLANRFLWFATRRSKFLPSGGRFPELELFQFSERVKSAVAFARSMGEMRRDREADELWHLIYRRLERDEPGMMGAVTARAAAQCMRLSLVYALLDESHEIRREHLEAGVGLWDYALCSARYIFGSRLGDGGSDKTMEALRAAGESGMSRNEIRDKLFAGKIKAKELDRYLAVLVEADLVSTKKVPTGGRPTECWYAK